MTLPAPTLIWLDAIATAMLHSLWQVPAIALPAAVLLLTMPRHAAGARSFAATAALILSGVVFIATLTRTLDAAATVTPAATAASSPGPTTLAPDAIPPRPWTETSEVLNTLMLSPAMASLLVEAAAQPGASAPHAEPTSVPSIRSLTATAWVTGMLLLQMRLTWQWLNCVRLRRRGIVPVDTPWLERFDALRASAGLSARTRMLASTRVDSPMVLGWLTPVVLIPAAALTAIPRAQLEMVIRHELEHIRRLDPLTNILMQLAANLLFFHPVAWWLLRTARAEREFACDAVATRSPADARLLAEGLLRLESMRLARPALALSSQGGPLMTRVSRLFTTDRPAARPRFILAPTLVAMAAISAAIPLAQAETRESAATSLQPLKKVDDSKLVDRSIRTIKELAERGIISHEDAADGIAAIMEAYAQHKGGGHAAWHDEHDKGDDPDHWIEELDAERERIHREMDVLRRKVESGKLDRREAGPAFERLEMALRDLDAKHRELEHGTHARELAEKSRRLDAADAETRRLVEAGAISREEAEQRIRRTGEARREMHEAAMWMEHERLLEGLEHRRKKLHREKQAIRRKAEAGEMDRREAAAMLERLETELHELDVRQREHEHEINAREHAMEMERLETAAAETRRLVEAGRISPREAEQRFRRIEAAHREMHEATLHMEHERELERMELHRQRIHTEMDSVRRRARAGEMSREDADAMIEELERGLEETDARQHEFERQVHELKRTMMAERLDAAAADTERMAESGEISREDAEQRFRRIDEARRQLHEEHKEYDEHEYDEHDEHDEHEFDEELSMLERLLRAVEEDRINADEAMVRLRRMLEERMEDDR
jgi:beta-lactamase regulating signal transducer with metallopeptidase domain